MLGGVIDVQLHAIDDDHDATTLSLERRKERWWWVSLHRAAALGTKFVAVVLIG